jgi:cyclic pyranopterin phosphate synthase
LFPGLKIDTVVIRGVNDDEIVPMVEFARSRGAEVRFIEYMDVGGATHWNRGAVMSQEEMLAALEAHYGRITPLGGRGSAPADRFALPDGTTFGLIASTTRPFCEDCDRSRLTADGVWLMCLYAQAGTDLRRPLRAGATRDDLVQLIRTVWSQRADRGAEERLAVEGREALIPVAALKKNAHLEMHTRGG